MRAIEHPAEEEPVVKKARIVDNVENVPIPMLSQLQNVEVVKETRVASTDDGSENGQVCETAVEEEKVTSVEQVESNNERKIEEVSALSWAEREDIGPKENQELEIEEKEVVVVSDEANTDKLPVLEMGKNNEASVTSAVTSRYEIPAMHLCVASGGINEVSRSNPSVPRKKLLVLDLNGLLADIGPIEADRKADINIGRRAIYKRPFCEDFLKFCFDKFEVGIWSSRKRNNVDRITEFLLGDMKSKLLFCWDMSYCATTTVGSLENKFKFVVFKELNQLWEKHDPRLPWKKFDYNETNTVLLDDSPYKALLNPPYTAIFPHSYSYKNNSDTSLGDGGDLRLHLEKLVEAENVQDFIKKNPFGQEAITEASESWEFYRQAIVMHTYAYRNLI
ncbi:unnamed protein product, partial [Thlaspi arvense]